MALIEKNAFKEKYLCCGYLPEMSEEEFDSFPVIYAAPVVHGRWEFPAFTNEDDGLDPRVKCSECGGIEAAFARWKYCPNCGARMDGGEDDAKA